MTCATPARDIGREIISGLVTMEVGAEERIDELVEQGFVQLAEACAALTRLVQLQTESDDPAVIAHTRRQFRSAKLALLTFKASRADEQLDPDAPAAQLLEKIMQLTDADDKRADESCDFAREANEIIVTDVARAAAVDPRSAIEQLAPWIPPSITESLRVEARTRSAVAHRARIVMRAARARRRHAPRNRSSRRCGRRGPPARAREDDDPESPSADEGGS